MAALLLCSSRAQADRLGDRALPEGPSPEEQMTNSLISSLRSPMRAMGSAALIAVLLLTAAVPRADEATSAEDAAARYVLTVDGMT